MLASLHFLYHDYYMIDYVHAASEESFVATRISAAVLVGSLMLSGCGSGAKPGPGYDVSHPQCNTNLPDARSFAIIGFNKGAPKSLNPCFEEQMEWALESAGDKTHTKASIYVNVANPGKAKSTEWPSDGENQFGACRGENTQACAFEYGEDLAEWNLTEYATKFEKNLAHPATEFKWWIDVEVGTYWQCNQGMSKLCGQKNVLNTKEGALGRNAAVLKGMASAFRSAGINIGIYTNPRDWNLIAGQQAKDSVLQGSEIWINGSSSFEEARMACQTKPFGGLGSIVLSQYNTDYSKNLDQNIICAR